MLKETYLPAWMKRDEKTGKLVFCGQKSMTDYDMYALQSDLLYLVENLEDSYERHCCAGLEEVQTKAELVRLMHNFHDTLNDCMRRLEKINQEHVNLRDENLEYRYQLFKAGLRDSVVDIEK